MKATSNSAVCVIAALLVCGVAVVLDVWMTSAYAFYNSDYFLWVCLLSRALLAVPVGLLCWTAMRGRPALVVSAVCLVCSVLLLLAFLIVPVNSSIHVFRKLEPYRGGHESLYASLLFVAAVSVAAIIRRLASDEVTDGMMPRTRTAVSIFAAFIVCGTGRLLDVVVASSTSYGGAQIEDTRFLWTATLSRMLLASLLGLLCWITLHRGQPLVVPTVYLAWSIPLLLAFMIVPAGSSFDIFRNLAPGMGGYENLYASLVFVAGVGVAALIARVLHLRVQST